MTPETYWTAIITAAVLTAIINPPIPDRWIKWADMLPGNWPAATDR